MIVAKLRIRIILPQQGIESDYIRVLLIRGNELVKSTFCSDVLTIASYWLVVPSKQRTSVRGFLGSRRSPVSVIARVKGVGG